MNEQSKAIYYRDAIYQSYGTTIQSAPESLDENAARRWGKAYAYYLREWMPASRAACIVDLACGYGRLLYFYKERGYSNISGVDISPDQVARARQIVHDTHEGDVLDFLQVHPGEFNLISALDLIEHLTKDEVLQFVDSCYKALRPGGRLVLQTPNADSPFAMAIRYGDFTHEVCFSPSMLSRLLTLQGYVQVEAREIGPVPWSYSFASTVRWLAWQVLRKCVRAWNLVETGNAGSNVLTRNFLVSGIRR